MPFITIHDAQMHYKDYRQAGSSQMPLILIHGAGSQHLDWAIETRRSLGAIALDLPAHGRSTGQRRNTIADYAHDVITFMDALAIERAIFVGHSMGGAIVQSVALDYPDRVYGLVLIASAATFLVSDKIINGIIEKPDETARRIMDWAWSRETEDTIKVQGAKRLLETPTAVIQGDYLACRQFDSTHRLSEITMPTLILASRADRMVPLACSNALQAGIPNSTLTLIADDGHMIQLQVPQRINRVIRDWLAETF